MAYHSVVGESPKIRRSTARPLDALLKELDATRPDGLPESLLIEAVGRRKEITNALIAAVNEAADQPAVVKERKSHLYYWAAFLLAHFSEPRALEGMVGLVQLHAGPFKILVSEMTDYFDVLLSSVAGANPQPIIDLLNNPPSKDVRLSALIALETLHSHGSIGANEIEAVFAKVVQTARKKDTFIASTIARTAVRRNWRGLVRILEEADRRGIIDRPLYHDLESDKKIYLSEWTENPKAKFQFQVLPVIDRIDDIVKFFRNKRALEDGLF